jgi:hypothetical protein
MRLGIYCCQLACYYQGENFLRRIVTGVETRLKELKRKISVVLVHDRTTPTELQPLVGGVSANFGG